ncbi:MAG: carbohydrate binding domain-containing protein [Patescibacteria group bacterium]|nr:carbohydrate binding domain-containing protein [Patescibacteria group bacterium]
MTKNHLVFHIPKSKINPLTRLRVNVKESGDSFTLIELLIVIAIIGILASALVLILNPSQLLSQSRDSSRIQEMGSLNSAISMYLSEGNSILGQTDTVYVSIPDPTLGAGATSTCSSLGLPTLPTNWSYECVSTSSLRNTNGTGWLPVNFQNVSSGSPIPELPIDPINATSTYEYYMYVTSGSSYQLSAFLESTKYQSTAINSGSGNPYLYETGTGMSLGPYEELLTNADFNTGSLSGWINNAGGTTGVVTSPTHWALHSAIIQGSNSYCNNYYIQDIPVQQNTTYTLSAWVKTVSEVGRSGVLLANTSWGSSTSSLITGTNDWTYVSVNENSGSNTTLRFTVTVQWCGGSSPGQGPSGTSYFADVSAVAGSLTGNEPR